MDGSALPDLADLRAFPGAGGCQLCDWSAELSITGAQGEAGHSQGQVFLITPPGSSGTHLQGHFNIECTFLCRLIGQQLNCTVN